MNKIFDEVKKFLSKHEINIVDIFLDSDEDDGYLDRNELKHAFEKLGQALLNNEQISSFYCVFDPYKTQKID